MTSTPRDPNPPPKLKPWHLDRAAVAYVRQSTPQQVLDHQESTARQYALADRAVALGWPRSQVQVIDDGLGKSGQSAEGRPGFQRLPAEVALDRVGLILGLELSRLARSCKDWHHRLGLCARFRVLLADADMIYDPTEYSDRFARPDRHDERVAGEIPTLWRAPTTTSADRRQVVRLLIGRVVLDVAPGDDRVTVRVEWAGGSVRERAIRRDVQGYEHQQDWPRLSARAEALHGDGEAPKAIATALDRDGFRPPRQASRFTAGMVRRLLHELGLRPRVPRREATAGALSPGERWLHDLARDLGLSPHTLHGWRKKGWMHARQAGGRGGPWAVWADATELDRLRALKDCPRLWTHRERLAE